MHTWQQIGKKADSRATKVSFQTLTTHDFVVPAVLPYLPIKDALQLLYTNKRILLSRGKRDLKSNQIIYGFDFLSLDTPSGEARYVGWVENGELNKLGLLQIPTRTYTYSGFFLNGERHGWGSEQTDACCYVGEFQNDSRHGIGHCDLGTEHCIKYTGEWENSKICGTGELSLCWYFESENVPALYTFQGEWVDDKRHGCGIVTLVTENDCLRVEGQWQDNQLINIVCLDWDLGLADPCRISVDMLTDLEAVVFYLRLLT